MSQELINWLHGLYIETGYNEAQQAADTIQYLLDGADEVNKALREQIEANERLTAENERLSRPTLSQLRRERIQLREENERLKMEAGRDYAEMRRFQAKYIEADHELIALKGGGRCHQCYWKAIERHQKCNSCSENPSRVSRFCAIEEDTE